MPIFEGEFFPVVLFIRLYILDFTLLEKTWNPLLGISLSYSQISTNLCSYIHSAFGDYLLT